MAKNPTLSEITDSAREKYPHVAELSKLREQADERIQTMLGTLSQARKHSGLTQAKVAKILGVSQSTISRWESGEEEISVRDFVFFMQACKEKIALLAVPGESRFSDEEMASAVVATLIEQLYPEVEIEGVVTRTNAPRKARVKRMGNTNSRNEMVSRVDRSEMSVAATEIAAATRTAAVSFSSLGVVLEARAQCVTSNE